jgi:hypothetical protein
VCRERERVVELSEGRGKAREGGFQVRVYMCLILVGKGMNEWGSSTN